MQVVEVDCFLVPRQAILTVFIVLVDDTHRGIVNTQLVDNVVKSILDLQPVGSAYKNEILLTCQSRGQCGSGYQHMIGSGQVFDRERRRCTKAISNHRYLSVNLVIELNLKLGVVLRVLFKEFYLVSIDTTASIDRIEVDLNATCQRLAYRVCNRPGIG